MAALDLDTLFTIAGAAPVLDAVEADLRKAGKNDKADALMKLQQDAGIDIEREMTGGADLDTPSGPQTAALTAVHAEVTPARLSLLNDCYAALSPGKTRDGLQEVIRQLPAAAAPAAAPAPKKAI